MWLDGRDCRARTLLEAWLVLGAATREHDSLQAWPHTTQKNMLQVAPTKTHGVYGGSAVDHVLLCVCVLSHLTVDQICLIGWGQQLKHAACIRFKITSN